METFQSNRTYESESEPGIISTGRLHWVDPLKINLVSDLGLDRRQELLRMSGEVLDGDWDRSLKKVFEELDVYQALYDRLICGKLWQETPFYHRVINEINAGTVKWGCTDESQFIKRVESIERLYQEIRERGYQTQETLGSGKIEDEVRVGIRRDGRFVFLDGRHRLSIARLLRIPKIPVRAVVRHIQWEQFKGKIWAYANERNGRIYQTIDHPDLLDIPAHYGTGRISTLTNALSGYDCAGKQLLDIGTHWGYMCQQMEALGFNCTGIERNKDMAQFAERIRTATESRFAIWQGDIFDFPNIEGQNVILALNIFHHLIKTEKLHNKLVHLLDRIRADIILFQPHVSAPPGQMANAFRNYAPDEFAHFVATHANMSSVEYLGKEHNGRRLYKITK
jgi:2-polyprenyl-3-methyl-5-hydroxy-6-metoxy-1,4-benzoquinol methylase